MSTALTLVRLVPDREALARWAARRRLPMSDGDLGYVWHSVLKAVLGELAPQPFVDRASVQSNEVLGYVSADLREVRARLGRGSDDVLTNEACGLAFARANDLPTNWTAGRELSFEVRARPVVRTRAGARSGKVDEIDVAPHSARNNPDIGREQAYVEWLDRQLRRDGAASLVSSRLHAFRRSRVSRRSADGESRRWAGVEGPDAWLRGRLKIDTPESFDALLRRGIGRHRAFGFGCLLIAPPGMLG